MKYLIVVLCLFVSSCSSFFEENNDLTISEERNINRVSKSDPLCYSWILFATKSIDTLLPGITHDVVLTDDDINVLKDTLGKHYIDVNTFSIRVIKDVADLVEYDLPGSNSKSRTVFDDFWFGGVVIGKNHIFINYNNDCYVFIKTH